MRKWIKRWASGVLLMGGLSSAWAAADSREDPLLPIIHTFIQQTLIQQEGRQDALIEVTPALTESAGDCQAPSPFMPAGQLLKDNIVVGVKCINAQGREVPRYYRAHIGEENDYWVAAHDLMPGDIIGPDSIRPLRGDITRLGGNIVTTSDVLLGQRLTRRVAAGIPLQQSMVKPPLAINRNARINVTARNPGFTITAQGTAMDDASVDGQLRVKMDSKKIIMARATAAGEAEVIQ